MNLIAQAINRLANLARESDPDKLRSVVSGKTVLVTGASYGIGEATARKLTQFAADPSAAKLPAIVASALRG